MESDHKISKKPKSWQILYLKEVFKIDEDCTSLEDDDEEDLQKNGGELSDSDYESMSRWTITVLVF
jgi:hypothetical protein